MEIRQIKKMVKVGLASFHFPHREMECPIYLAFHAHLCLYTNVTQECAP